MKSYINVLADFHDAPIDKEPVIPYPAEELEKKLRAVARTGKKVVPPDAIEAGDVAVIAMESELPKYNKAAAFVTVAGGLLNKKLEETLIGRSAGDSYETEADGKPVKVTVKQISRTIFPEPDDDMVRAYAAVHDEYEGVETLEDYKKRVIDDYFKDEHANVIYRTIDDCMEYLLTHSDFAFDEEELQAVTDEYMSSVRNSLAEQGKTSLDELTEKEMLALFELSSKEEVEELIAASAEREIASVLIMAKLHDQDVSELSLEEAFETFMDYGPIEDYVKEELNIKEDR